MDLPMSEMQRTSCVMLGQACAEMFAEAKAQGNLVTMPEGQLGLVIAYVAKRAKLSPSHAAKLLKQFHTHKAVEERAKLSLTYTPPGGRASSRGAVWMREPG